MNNMPAVPSNYTNDELLTHIYHYCSDLPQAIAVALDRFSGLIDENSALIEENNDLEFQIDILKKEKQQLEETLNGNND